MTLEDENSKQSPDLNSLIVFQTKILQENEQGKNLKACVDSGANCFVINQRELFSDLQNCSGSISVTDERVTAKYEAKGIVKFNFKGLSEIIFEFDAYFVPSARLNILPLKPLLETGLVLFSTSTYSKLVLPNKQFVRLEWENKIAMVEIQTPETTASLIAQVTLKVKDDDLLEHQRRMHFGSVHSFCAICTQVKAKMQPAHRVEDKATRPTDSGFK